MRKFYSLLIALLAVCGMTSAQTTFTAGVDLGTQSNAGTGADVVTKDGVTISVTKGAFAAAQYRFAKGSTATITSTEGNITKIVFTCSAEGESQYGPGCFEAQDGYTFEGAVGTWTGSATEVTFVASTAQVRATTIAVSIDGKDPEGGETPDPEPQPTIDWTSSAEAPLTVAAVLEKAAQLKSGQSSTSDKVYVKGKISQIKYTFSASFGTAQFSISDNGEAENEFLCYGTYYLGNRAWVEGDDQIAVGDEVIVCGTVTNYNGTLETVNKKNYLYSLNGKTDGGETPEPPTPDEKWNSSAEAPITVAKALELIASLEANAKSPVEVYVAGKINYIKEVNESYGNASYSIADALGSQDTLLIYRGFYFEGKKFPAADKIKVGDDVVIVGLLQNYVKDETATPEVASGSKLYSLNGKTKDDDPEPEPYVAEGAGELDDPYTINDVLNLGNVKEGGPQGWVLGYIVGYINGQSYKNGCIFSAEAPEGTDKEGKPLEVAATNLLLAATADVTDPEQCVPVQLPVNMREALSLKNVPTNLGRRLWICGDLIRYFSVPGVKNLSDYSFDGLTTGVSVVEATTVDQPIYNLAGQRLQRIQQRGLYIVGGRKVVVK